MKKTILVIVMASVAAMFVSCATTQPNVKYSYNENTTKTLDLDGSGVVTPIAADVNVKGARFVWTETFDNDLKEKDVNNPKNSAAIKFMKDFTLAKALKESNSDLLIAPVYGISTSGDLRKITVTVSGYPATYYNFRKATNDDFELIRKASGAGASTSEEPAAEPAIKLPFGK